MKNLLTFIFVFFLLVGNSTLAQEKVQLANDWKMISSESIPSISPKQISSPSYNDQQWKKAIVPGTVMGNLVRNGEYPDVLESRNLENVSEEQFKSPWWYRTSFDVKDDLDYFLILDGINYKADIYLNGHQIADTSEVKNTYRQFEWEVSKWIQRGENILAIRIYPPEPGDLSIGFVDWNPNAPDRNMGVWRPVYLKSVNKVNLDKVFVKADLPDLHRAELQLQIELKSVNKEEKDLTLRLELEGNTVLIPIHFRGNDTLINFSSEDDVFFRLSNPKLWWPVHYGEPNLYQMHLSIFDENAALLDQQSLTFGIRSFDDYINEKGWRGYKVNDQPFVVLGAGWSDRIFLDDTYEELKAQLQYVKDMGLNTIRVEGFFGNSQDMYNLCDSLGIMVINGWSAQWEYIDYVGKETDPEYGGVLTPYEIDLIGKAFRDQVIWLRNHPSIFLWIGGSDTKAKPELEESYFETIDVYDGYRCYIPAASEKTSLFGPSRVKMRGPYDYEPPMYWYTDTLYGGAFGFNTEAGPGAQIPTYISLRKMLNEDELWPISESWDFHAGRVAFSNIDIFRNSLKERYGEAEDAELFAYKAQIMNYELMRPMYEAYASQKYQSTGIIQWMLNSAWPGMYWQLYDFYGVPTGAYYGAKAANKKVQAIYNYGNNQIQLVNNGIDNYNSVQVAIELYSLDGKQLYDNEVKVKLEENEVVYIDKLPEWLDTNPIHFLRLITKVQGKEESNFYWLSRQEDVLDYEAEVKPWYFHTPAKSYANFTALDRLPKISLEYEIIRKGEKEADIVVKNPTDAIAFGIELSFADIADGSIVAPYILEDNYFSMLPGDTKTVSLKLLTDKQNITDLEMIAHFWNQKEVDPPLGLEDANADKINFRAFPSFFNHNLHAEVNLPNEEVCTLEVFDAKGTLIKVIFEERLLLPGKHLYPIELDGTQSKSFLIILKTKHSQFKQTVFRD